jgi:uncharacterized protein (TIGR00288 family)
MSEKNGSRVVVLIDYENMVIGFRDKFGPQKHIAWDKLLAAIEKYGDTRICRVYSDWSGNWNVQDEFSSLGAYPVNVPSKRRGKNGADVNIAVDALDLMMIKNADIDNLIIMSGDGDFTALVNYLKEHGKYVVGIGVQGSTADYLEGFCNEYKYLMEDSSLQDAKQTEPTAQTLRVSSHEPKTGQMPSLMAVSPGTPGKLRSAGALAAAAVAPQEEIPAEKDAGVSRPEKSALTGGLAEVDTPRRQKPTEKKASPSDLQETVAKYLKILDDNRIPMTPSGNRSLIVERFFYLYREHAGAVYKEISQRILNDFGKNSPDIPKAQVINIQRQILRSKSLSLESKSGKTMHYRLMQASLADAVKKPSMLLFKIDEMVLKTIIGELGPDSLDPKAVSTILYDTSEDPEQIERAKKMIKIVTSS